MPWPDDDWPDDDELELELVDDVHRANVLNFTRFARERRRRRPDAPRPDDLFTRGRREECARAVYVFMAQETRGHHVGKAALANWDRLSPAERERFLQLVDVVFLVAAETRR